ncbi:MAG: mobile mystery protein B [Candidatus Margulisiibacteriota bacterium]
MVIVSGKDPIGATPLDDYSDLKLDYITTKKELYEAEFANITSTIGKYLLKSFSIDKLMTSTLLYRIHKDMFSEVWSWAGKKRTSNKSIGVDKKNIDIEIHKLLGDFRYWLTSGKDDLEISAFLHHRLVYIHPFENGNGRWTRFVTNIFLKNRINKIIQWPEEEIYISDTFRNRYIAGLRNADDGDYSELISIHRELMQL